MWFLSKGFPLLLDAWDGLRYFIVTLRLPSIYLFRMDIYPYRKDIVRIEPNVVTVNRILSQHQNTKPKDLAMVLSVQRLKSSLEIRPTAICPSDLKASEYLPHGFIIGFL